MMDDLLAKLRVGDVEVRTTRQKRSNKEPRRRRTHSNAATDEDTLSAEALLKSLQTAE